MKPKSIKSIRSTQVLLSFALAAFAAPALDFSQVAAVTIPEGAVESISTLDGEVLWQRTPTARDYVQSGLIAMWDGIENAGWGVHDASATTWKDLVGTRDASLSNAANGWAADALLTQKASASPGVAATFTRISFSAIGAIETVYRVDSPVNSNGETILFVGGGSGSQKSALSFVAGGSAADSIRPTAPGTRIVAYAAYNPPGLITTGARHATSINFGETDSASGWTMTQDGQPLQFSAYSGTLNIQTDQGSFFGRTLQDPHDNADGELCAVRLYSRALTAEEIAHNYEIDRKRFGF